MDRDAFAWSAPVGTGWTSGPPRRVHDNPWFAVDAYEATAPTGAATPYYVQAFKNHAVGVLALDASARIALVGQWRFPFARYSWELPEGGAPKSETPLAGAQRELREETGLEAADWRQVLTLQLSNASSDETAYGFLATGLTRREARPDATEDLALRFVPFAEAVRAAGAGLIQDAITVAMLYRVHHMAYSGELEGGLARRMLTGPTLEMRP